MERTDREYQELKDSVKAWLDAAIDEDLNSNPRGRRGIAVYVTGAVCAALLAAVIVLSGMHFGRDAAVSEWEEVVSSYGEAKSVTLSDGSVIRLRNDSRVFYPKNFSGNFRQVFVSGELYADIAKDRRHPFILSSDGVNVKVKGTKFNYRAYSGSPKVELALVEGSVQMSVDLSGAEKVMDIEAGTGIKFDRETGDIVRYSFNDGESIPWGGDKSLYFNNLTLDEIAARLERVFDVTIAIGSDKLRESRFYASFTDAESAEQVLDALCATNVMKVTKQGEKHFMITESK